MFKQENWNILSYVFIYIWTIEEILKGSLQLQAQNSLNIQFVYKQENWNILSYIFVYIWTIEEILKGSLQLQASDAGNEKSSLFYSILRVKNIFINSYLRTQAVLLIH